MGFLKNQQINIAVRLLAWQYEKQGQPMPGYAHLETHARKLVEDAGLADQITRCRSEYEETAGAPGAIDLRPKNGKELRQSLDLIKAY